MKNDKSDNSVKLDKGKHSPSQKFYLANKNFKDVYHSKQSEKPFKYIPSWLYNKSQYLKYKADNPNHSNKSYPRGSMVFVDFGVNSGSELSGSHFAIVLTKRDNPNSNTLTVVPLSSTDHGIFSTKIENTISSESLKYFQKQSDINHSVVGAYQLINLIQINSLKPLDETTTFFPDSWEKDANNTIRNFLTMEKIDPTVMNLQEQLLYFQDRITRLSIALKRFIKYDKSTYALTTQITTISKDRIRREKYEPVVRTTSQTLDEIEKSLAKFFFKNNPLTNSK